ncbi:MAG TPA: hypothetical protein VFK48_11080 [Usitatibacter sp.]|nr:hypothetical protein [Usitatibacter sp.]
MNSPARPDPREALRQKVAHILRGPPFDVQAVCAAGVAAHQLGLEHEASLMLRLAVDVLRHVIRQGDAPKALVLESLVYDSFVKAVETEEHYEKVIGQWRDAMAQLGRRYQAPSAMRAGSGVAFVFHNGVVLGHTEVLLRLLERRGRARPVRLYALFGCDDEFVARAAAIGVAVEAYRGSPEGPAAWLRQRMQANGESVAVWVSAPPAASFIFAARVAAVQIFWTLRYHAVHIPEIDGYITYGSWGESERVFHGQGWRVCPVPLALEPRPADAAQVAALRSRFPEKVLLGTLAREEKIDSSPFLQCVVEILRRHPQCGYLWTGRRPHQGIVEMFREAGVGDRCHFVGWVDTPLYAAALDVFLETFPLGCGITGYQALGAGVPLVSYLEPNTVFGMQYWSDLLAKAGSVDAVTREMLDEYPVLVARSKEEYVDLVSRLLSDEAFRARWTGREKAFYESEIGGVERYSRHFFATIDQIAAQASRP